MISVPLAAHRAVIAVRLVGVGETFGVGGVIVLERGESVVWHGRVSWRKRSCGEYGGEISCSRLMI